MCAEVDPLTAFLALIPFADRKRATVTILKVRKYLNEQIENTASFSRPATLIRNLKPIFTHLPITLRRSLKEKLFTALEQSLESSEALAVFTILLSIIETYSIRNSDRCDLEKDDIFNSLSSLIPILNNISQSILSRNTNLLSCRAWVVAMLVYTYRECLIWYSRQDCLDLTKEGLDEVVPIESVFYDSPSVPKILRIALDCQRTNKPPPSTDFNYSFYDLLLLSAFSDHASNFIFENTASNFPENRFDESCNSLKLPVSVKVHSKCQSLLTLQEVQKSIESKDLMKIRGNLELIERYILDNVPLQGDFKQICKEMIKSALVIMDTMMRRMEEIEVPNDLFSLYTGLLCGFLRVWIHCLERRLVLQEIPQSYLYLCCFMNIRYQDMILKDFVQSICVVSNFLTTYGRIFKAHILASPHWFLQMLKDSLTAIFDRLSSGKLFSAFCLQSMLVIYKCNFLTATDEEELTTLEYAICPCIASISRTWASLHAEEPDTRPELSRSIQG
ncbi:unnamed protein product, partial [Rodentolepis nana]|uniref:HECT domain-containing protein n=1 Tax=Rodentolepis nana TaxID=102285 RepID=A0A0R3T4W8_RODNA